jgi:hypothetical protein
MMKGSKTTREKGCLVHLEKATMKKMPNSQGNNKKHKHKELHTL